MTYSASGRNWLALLCPCYGPLLPVYPRQSLTTLSRHIYDNFIQPISRSVYPFYFMNVNILPIAIASLEPCAPSLPNTSRVIGPSPLKI